jgi:hypothetical protein
LYSLNATHTQDILLRSHAMHLRRFPMLHLYTIEKKSSNEANTNHGNPE